MDACILSQETSSADSSSTESDVQLFPESQMYHPVSPTQQSTVPTFQDKYTLMHADDPMVQSNIADDVHVQPVISLDVAHLHSKRKGMIFTYIQD